MHRVLAVGALTSMVASCILFDNDRRHTYADDVAPPPPTTCSNLADEFAAATADRGTCNVDADCQIVGGHETPTCGCAPTLGDCSGTAIARNAPDLPAARNIESAYYNSCDISECGTNGVDCVCDCEPASGVTCSNHRCVAIITGNCFGIPDAGDPPPPDAPYYPDAP